MTEDEQEALSFRYVMPRIMRLSSGNWVLLIDGKDPQFFVANDYIPLLQAVPASDEIEAYQESLRASRPKATLGKLTQLNLADLGL